jgi:hypothetical protein
MLGGLLPKYAVFLIDRVPSKLLAFLSLFSEELFFINQLGKDGDLTLQ